MAGTTGVASSGCCAGDLVGLVGSVGAGVDGIWDGLVGRGAWASGSGGGGGQ